MPHILVPFRSRTYRLWSGANLVSITGTWMQVLAGNWLLLMATGSATQMGIGVLMHAIPAVVLGPWAGAIADRVRPWPLLTATQLLHALLAAGLGVLAWSGTAAVPCVYAAMLLGGVVSAVEGPALGRFGSTMVDRDQLGAALAIGSLVGAGGRVIGLSVGGIVISAAGPAPLFLFNAISFLVVIKALYRVRPAVPDPVATAEPVPDPVATAEPVPDPVATAEPVPESAWAGLRYLLRDPVVLITLGLAFLLGSLGRNYQVTMAAMTAGPLRGGADSYGLLSTVFALGAVAGGMLAARASRMYGRQLVLIGVAMSGLQVLSGLAPGLWWYAASLLPIAAAAVVVDTVVSTRLQLDKPLAVRGRVLAAVGATGAVAGAIGAPVLGWLCDSLGPRGALGLAGLVAAAGCVAAGIGYAAVRRRGDDRISVRAGTSPGRRWPRARIGAWAHPRPGGDRAYGRAG